MKTRTRVACAILSALAGLALLTSVIVDLYADITRASHYATPTFLGLALFYVAYLLLFIAPRAERAAQHQGEKPDDQDDVPRVQRTANPPHPRRLP